MNDAIRRLERLPNEWHDTGGAIFTPYAIWQAAWPHKLSHETRVQLRELHTALGGAPIGAADEDLLPQVAAAIALHLQTSGSFAISEWVAGLAQPRQRGFSYPIFDGHIANLCGRGAFSVLSSVLEGRNAGSDELHARALKAIDQVLSQVVSMRPNEGTLGYLFEALARGIPVARFSKRVPTYRLGHGHTQKRLWKGFTSATEHIATVLTTHKEITNQILRDHGFPVARQEIVADIAAAKKAAQAIGYPVVVKPSSSDHGTAVSTGITNETALAKAFVAARAHGAVIVERHVDGLDHRLTVVDGKCIAVIRRVSARVIGNGVDTVADLLQGQAARRVLDPILRQYASASLADPMVAQALADQGVAPGDVPAQGATVMLRTNSNISTGGTGVNMTAQTHPDNLRMAERSAACLGLDYAGIDFITSDISRSWRDVGGAICELNPTPGPVTVDASARLIDYLFPNRGNGRIPVIVIVADAARAAEMLAPIAAIVQAEGLVLGAVVDGNAVVDGFNVAPKQESPSRAVSIVLADPAVDVAVFQVEAAQLEAAGLDLPYCDIALICADDETVQRLARSTLSVVGRAAQVVVRPQPGDVAGLVERRL